MKYFQRGYEDKKKLFSIVKVQGSQISVKLEHFCFKNLCLISAGS